MTLWQLTSKAWIHAWSSRARRTRDTDIPNIEQSRFSFLYTYDIEHTAKKVLAGLTIVDSLPAIDIYQIRISLQGGTVECCADQATYTEVLVSYVRASGNDVHTKKSNVLWKHFLDLVCLLWPDMLVVYITYPSR